MHRNTAHGITHNIEPKSATALRIAVIATASLVGSLGIVGVSSDRASALEMSTTHYSDATADFLSKRKQSGADQQAAVTAIGAAKAALASSEGRVLDDAVRTELNDEIRRQEMAVAVSVQEMKQSTTAFESENPKPDFWGGTEALDRASIRLDSLNFVAASRLDAVADILAPHVQAQTDAIAAWDAEQARIAAEAEAARVAAEQAAAEAAAAVERSSRSSSGGSRWTPAPETPWTPGGPSVDHVENVWAYGYQAEIDACNGSVNVSGDYGTTAIGEHWSCGGSSFPIWSGAVVQVNGAGVDGLYRVDGVAAYLDSNVHTTADVPHGYDLLYQTCIGGNTSNMALVILTKIG